VIDPSAVVKTLIAPHRKSAVVIYRRPDGRFSFREIVRIWPDSDRLSRRFDGVDGSIYETAEVAEQEARAKVDWLRRQISN
jgi:hypothetical protein